MPKSLKNHLLESSALNSDTGLSQPPNIEISPQNMSFTTYSGSAGKPLKPDERGLIIPQSIHVSDSSIKSGEFINEEALKASLFFWDRIDVPENGRVDMGVPTELEYLIQEGILQRTRVEPHSKNQMGGDNLIQYISLATWATLQDLEIPNPGQWALGRKTSYPDPFSNENKVSGRGLVFDLIDAIPVPHKDVPFEDILEFKFRRFDELVALRYHLDEVYQSIIQSTDFDFSKSTQFSKLDRSIADHIKASRESGIKLSVSPLSFSIDTGAGAAAALTSLSVGLPATQALLVGLAAASVSVKSGFGLKGRSKTTTPFQYIVGIQKEFQ